MVPWLLVGVLLLAICCHQSGQTKTGFTLEQGIPHFNTKPYFLQAPKRNITALEGQSAYIHCRVAQLGDKKVSWVRRRDVHVLTSGLHTFASDQRFLALHQERSENWTLQIRFSQVRDAGEYQCQVNTDPPISMIFSLNILEATTWLEGSDQRYVRAGSTISLVCNTSVPSQTPGLLYWYRDTDMLTQGGRVNIISNLDGVVTSRLEVQAATERDSGNYTCWPTKFHPASVMVHVIPEEKPAQRVFDGKGSEPGSVKKKTPSPPPSLGSQISAGSSLSLLQLIMLQIVWYLWCPGELLTRSRREVCIAPHR